MRYLQDLQTLPAPLTDSQDLNGGPNDPGLCEQYDKLDATGFIVEAQDGEVKQVWYTTDRQPFALSATYRQIVPKTEHS